MFRQLCRTDWQLRHFSDMGEEAALLCANLAEQKGHSDLVPIFRRMAGEKPRDGAPVRPEEWTPEEHDLAAALLDIKRYPSSVTDRLIPSFIFEAAANRKREGARKAKQN